MIIHLVRTKLLKHIVTVWRGRDSAFIAEDYDLADELAEEAWALTEILEEFDKEAKEYLNDY